MSAANRILVAAMLVAGCAIADEARKVDVPAGSYVRCMTCALASDKVTITVKPFRIDQDEVTAGAYLACVKAGKCGKQKGAAKDGDWPVANVSWEEASAYCKFAGGRLPTAAEWERVAFPSVAGQKGSGPLHAKADLCSELNVGGYDKKSCAGASKTPWAVTAIRVGREPGLIVADRSMVGEVPVYDLFGNVAEWVADFDALPGEPEYFFKPKTTTDPVGPVSGDNHLILGGSFAATEGVAEAQLRFGAPKDRARDVGFRCAYGAGK